METIQIGKDAIDWKGLQKEWNKNPLSFAVTFRHGENTLVINSELIKKQFKLMICINGWYKYSGKEHKYSIYMNKTELKPSKRAKEFQEINKKLAKLTKQKWEEPEPYFMYLPIFSSFNEVKKMVESLPKL